MQADDPDNSLSRAAEFLRHYPADHHEFPPGTGERVDAAIESLIRELSKHTDVDELLAELEREILW